VNEVKAPLGLPENAFRELKPGETYVPSIPQETGVAEITSRSITFGIAMIILFAAAASYIALKLGQGIETAIPIGILAVGYSALARRKSILIENVNILAVGCTSGILVGGAVFVMPAIFMLNLQSPSFLATFFQIFLVPFLGAVLGVLFLIPFRKYFVAEMHGKLPYPEATATTEILVAGEKGGSSAKVLVYSLGIGIVLDYLALTFRTWSDVFTTAAVPALQNLTDKVKMVFQMNTSAAVLGLGMIIGVRYASIIMAGSLVAFLGLIPLFAFVSPVYGAHTYREIFYGWTNEAGNFIPGVRYIGIGGIFAAGVISILKMSPVIKQALQQVISQLFKKHAGAEGGTRLDRDMKMSMVFGLAIALAVVIFIYFRFVAVVSEPSATAISLIALVLTFLIVFLFSAVSAWAIAMISVTPISGMTITTLIIASVILALLGLKGASGMLAILLIGGVVCTALSMSGSLVTQFKIGYWLGSTPKTIQWSNIAGSALASLTVTAVIMLFANVYGFGTPSAAHPNPLPAPQASAMAAVANSFMGGQDVPWMLYVTGAVMAIAVTLLGISPLAFALGMYLPIELNSPILLGACVGWLINHSAKGEKEYKEKTNKARGDKSILIASGFIAGGALAGVFDALSKTLRFEPEPFLAEGLRNWLGLIIFLALAAFLYWDSCKARAEDGH